MAQNPMDEIRVNTRVRFVQKDGMFLTREFLAGNKLVWLLLDDVNKRLHVFDKERNELLMEEHQGKSLKQLKVLSKELLKKAGVVFYEETREKQKVE